MGWSMSSTAEEAEREREEWEGRRGGTSFTWCKSELKTKEERMPVKRIPQKERGRTSRIQSVGIFSRWNHGVMYSVKEFFSTFQISHVGLSITFIIRKDIAQNQNPPLNRF